MENNAITIFLGQHSDKFPADRLPLIKQHLEKLNDEQLLQVQTADYKSPVLMLIVSLLVGTLGVDRFLLGQTGLGLVKLLTCGGIGFWTIVDWFIIMSGTRESNFEKLMRGGF